jgi:phytoene dehydrogenase-like protein
VLEADAVVATVSAAPLAAMLPAGALSDRLARRLRDWRYGFGTFKLDYALSAPVPWSSEVARQAGVVHVGGPLGELAQAHARSAAGEVPERPTLVVGQHSIHDPGRAPEGRHTLYVYSRLPQRPALPDEEVAGRIEAQIERYAPGFANTILSRAIRSPAQLERDNPSLVGGDLAGGSMEADQQLVFRPAPRLVRYRTPVPGLYLGGPSVHPGAGVHGVSGRGAADALLADASPLRFWRRPFQD